MKRTAFLSIAAALTAAALSSTPASAQTPSFNTVRGCNTVDRSGNFVTDLNGVLTTVNHADGSQTLFCHGKLHGPGAFVSWNQDNSDVFDLGCTTWYVNILQNGYYTEKCFIAAP